MNHPTVRETYLLMRELHGRDLDKGGFPYWTHPLRVMLRLGERAHPFERMAALLHDTIEDTGITPIFLARRGYGPAVIHLVNLLTREPGLSTRAYHDRLCQSGNAMALRCKMADIFDNSAPARLEALLAPDQERFKKKYGELEIKLKKAFTKYPDEVYPESGDPRPGSWTYLFDAKALRAKDWSPGAAAEENVAFLPWRDFG